MEVGRKLLGLFQAKTVKKPESRNKIPTWYIKTLFWAHAVFLKRHKEANMLLNKQSQTFIQLKEYLGNVKPSRACCELFAFGNKFL